MTSLNVAQFPWDPKVEPNTNPPPTLLSNAFPQQQQDQYAGAPRQPSMYGDNNVGFPQPMGQNMGLNLSSGPIIKPEPGLESTKIMAPPLPANATAQDRAAAHLQHGFGSRALNSIQAIQGSAPQYQQAAHPQQSQNQAGMQHMQQMQPQQQNRMTGMYPQGQPQQAHMQQQPQMQQQTQMQQQQTQMQLQQQYQKSMAANAANAAAKIRASAANGSIGSAQNDGAGDEMGESFGVITRFTAGGEEVMGRLEIDELIRDKIAAMGQKMEGGGLMLSLQQATNTKKRQRKIAKSTSAPGQLDGPDSDEDTKIGVKDEEFDEDAITSDLDDPDEKENDEEDEEDTLNQIMLCMYDKVQRVKNKW